MTLSRRTFLVGSVVSVGLAGQGRPAEPAIPGAMRFGVTAPQGAPWPDLVVRWQEAEKLGFDSAFVYDHLMAAAPGPPSAERCFEAWTLLAALAARTERLRVGALVTANTFRWPSLLAKMAATVDHVSGGRLILGIGAGWLAREHEAYGIPFDTPGGRARRLVEAVEVIRRLFTEERATYAGRYYRLADAPCEPKPLQQPHPPLLIGGVGPKVVMPLAARHAQTWHFLVPGSSLDDTRALCARFDAICTRVGRNPSEVEKATSIDPRGPTTAVRDQVRSLRDLGVRHLVLPPVDRDVVRRFAEEIAPEFRRAPA